MVKNNLYNQSETEELEELEDDTELKELGNENLEEETKGSDEDDVLEEGNKAPETDI